MTVTERLKSHFTIKNASPINGCTFYCRAKCLRRKHRSRNDMTFPTLLHVRSLIRVFACHKRGTKSSLGTDAFLLEMMYQIKMVFDII